jgi:hypothetical protein
MEYEIQKRSGKYPFLLIRYGDGEIMGKFRTSDEAENAKERLLRESVPPYKKLLNTWMLLAEKQTELREGVVVKPLFASVLPEISELFSRLIFVSEGLTDTSSVFSAVKRASSPNAIRDLLSITEETRTALRKDVITLGENAVNLATHQTERVRINAAGIAATLAALTVEALDMSPEAVGNPVTHKAVIGAFPGILPESEEIPPEEADVWAVIRKISPDKN